MNNQDIKYIKKTSQEERIFEESGLTELPLPRFDRLGPQLPGLFLRRRCRLSVLVISEPGELLLVVHGPDVPAAPADARDAAEFRVRVFEPRRRDHAGAQGGRQAVADSQGHADSAVLAIPRSDCVLFGKHELAHDVSGHGKELGRKGVAHADLAGVILGAPVVPLFDSKERRDRVVAITVFERPPETGNILAAAQVQTRREQ